MIESLKQSTLSRRSFLKLGLLGLALAACGRYIHPPDETSLSPTRLPITDPPSPSREIVGPVPGEYSQLIREKELQPTVFTDYDTPETRINMVVDYLKRYRDLLRDNPQLRGNSLAYFRINTPDNYPISIPNTDNDNWTLYDVVNTFITEVDNGKMTLEYDSTQKKIAGTRNSYENIDGKWRRKTKIALGKDFMSQGSFHESNKYIYTRPTDAELAIILFHEYAHALQDEMILAYLNIDPNALAGVGINSNQAASWVTQKVDEKNDDMRKQFSISVSSDSTLSPDQLFLVKFNEAQANAIGYYFLYSLNQLNQSAHFPGTRRADPSEDDQKAIIEQNPGIHFINLYNLFVDEVVSNNNALNSLWLMAAGK